MELSGDNDDYDIITDNTLSQGRFAKVFHGKTKKDKNDVAAKKKEGSTLLKNDFDISVQLKHENIVKVMDLITIQSTKVWQWLIFEPCELGDLKTYVQNTDKKPSIVFTLDVINDIAQALEYLHSKDIIHNDLKPSNIYIAKSDSILIAKVSGFGFATPRSKTINIVEHLKECGTKLYKAPEYYRQTYPNPRIYMQTSSDVFALGLIFYALLVYGELRGLQPEKQNGDSIGKWLSDRENIDYTFAKLTDQDPEQQKYKELIIGMTKNTRTERSTLKEVMKKLNKTKMLSKSTKHEDGATGTEYRGEGASLEDMGHSDLVELLRKRDIVIAEKNERIAELENTIRELNDKMGPNGEFEKRITTLETDLKQAKEAKKEEEEKYKKEIKEMKEHEKEIKKMKDKYDEDIKELFKKVKDLEEEKHGKDNTSVLAPKTRTKASNAPQKPLGSSRIKSRTQGGTKPKKK